MSKTAYIIATISFVWNVEEGLVSARIQGNERSPSPCGAGFATLMIMGIATFIIGILPTYDTTGVFALVSQLPNDQFLAWGWRIPFLLSVVLIGIGLFIRLRVIESPMFEGVKASGTVVKAPLIELLKRYPKQIVLALGTRFATDITFNVMNVFMLAYGTQQLGLPRSFFLNAILIGCVVELFTLPMFGKLSDRIGRRKVYMMGAVFVGMYGFLFFQLVETRDPMYIVLAYICGLALSQASVYAVQSTWFAELFGTRVRYTGASLPYQIAGIITSGPAPLIATWLFATYHQTLPIALYIAVTAVISLVCAYFLAETYRRDLRADAPHEKDEAAFRAAAAVRAIGTQ